MDLQARIVEIQARIDRLRKIVAEGEVDNSLKPENIVEEPIIETKVHEEQPKPKSDINDIKAKLMKKK